MSDIDSVNSRDSAEKEKEIELTDALEKIRGINIFVFQIDRKSVV